MHSDYFSTAFNAWASISPSFIVDLLIHVYCIIARSMHKHTHRRMVCEARKNMKKKRQPVTHLRTHLNGEMIGVNVVLVHTILLNYMHVQFFSVASHDNRRSIGWLMTGWLAGLVIFSTFMWYTHTCAPLCVHSLSHSFTFAHVFDPWFFHTLAANAYTAHWHTHTIPNGFFQFILLIFRPYFSRFVYVYACIADSEWDSADALQQMRALKTHT